PRARPTPLPLAPVSAISSSIDLRLRARQLDQKLRQLLLIFAFGKRRLLIFQAIDLRFYVLFSSEQLLFFRCEIGGNLGVRPQYGKRRGENALSVIGL